MKHSDKKFKNTIFTGDRDSISEENIRILDGLVGAAALVNDLIDHSASGNLDRPLDTEELQFAFVSALVEGNKTRWSAIVLSCSQIQLTEMCNAAVKRANERVDAAHKESAAIIKDAIKRARYL